MKINTCKNGNTLEVFEGGKLVHRSEFVKENNKVFSKAYKNEKAVIEWTTDSAFWRSMTADEKLEHVLINQPV